MITRTQPDERRTPAAPRTRRWVRRAARTAMSAAIAAACSVSIAGPADAAPYGHDQWGAIALSRSTGRTAYTWDYATAGAATRAAVAKCGVADCRAVVQVANGCAALAQAPSYALGWGYGASRTTAERQARKGTGQQRAHVVGWVCTTGHR